MIPRMGRARFAGSLVLGGCWVRGGWLTDRRDDSDTNIIKSNKRSFVFLSGGMRRFPPSIIYLLRVLAAYTALGRSVFLPLFAPIRPTPVRVVLWYFRVLAPFSALGCSFFFSYFSWPLSCSSLSWVWGQGTLYLAVFA